MSLAPVQPQTCTGATQETFSRVSGPPPKRLLAPSPVDLGAIQEFGGCTRQSGSQASSNMTSVAAGPPLCGAPSPCPGRPGCPATHPPTVRDTSQAYRPPNSFMCSLFIVFSSSYVFDFSSSSVGGRENGGGVTGGRRFPFLLGVIFRCLSYSQKNTTT